MEIDGEQIKAGSNGLRPKECGVMTVSVLSVALCSRCFQSPDHTVSLRALRCPWSLKVWRLRVPARLTVEARTATNRNRTHIAPSHRMI
jgi:hypothetical protein